MARFAMQKEALALTDRPALAEPDRKVRGVRDSRSPQPMFVRTVVLSAVFAAAGLAPAGPAGAQEADPIGALLDQANQPPVQAPAPQVVAPQAPAPQTPAPQTPAPQTPAPQTPPTAGPQPYVPPPPISYSRPPRPQLSAPVHIDEVGKTPDGPPTPTDLNYEARIRGSFASAQGMQGALDGHWVVRAVQGGELYDLQLVDKNNGILEGAWRDPRRRGAADSSGFVDDIQRNGGQITARFQIRSSGDRATLTLSMDSNGGWSGDLTELGDRRGVTMKRN